MRRRHGLRAVRTPASLKVAAVSVLLCSTFACGDPAPDAGASNVDKAVKIAKEIKAAPGDAEATLKKHKMSEDDFEALMFEIAEDPKAAEQFASKMGGQ